jgi:hypothetical protein
MVHVEGADQGDPDELALFVPGDPEKRPDDVPARIVDEDSDGAEDDLGARSGFRTTWIALRR